MESVIILGQTFSPDEQGNVVIPFKTLKTVVQKLTNAHDSAKLVLDKLKPTPAEIEASKLLDERRKNFEKELADSNARFARSINSDKKKPRQWYLDLLKMPVHKPFLSDVPTTMRDKAMIDAYEAAGAHISLRDIPENLLTEERVKSFLNNSKSLIPLMYVPEALRTEEIVDAFIDKGVNTTEYIPEKLLTRERLYKLIDNLKNGERVLYFDIPDKLMDKEMVDKLASKGVLWLHMVPKALVTEELCTKLFEQHRAQVEDIPKSKMSYRVAQLALERDFIDLECIPVKHRDVNLCVAYCKKAPANLAYVPTNIRAQVTEQLTP